jgi:hypothetical protein
MNRDLPRKLISLPRNLQCQKKHPKKFKPRRKKLIYRLSQNKSPKYEKSVRSSENKENKGCRLNPISGRQYDNGNVKKSFLKEICPNEIEDNSVQFVLKSNEVKYEQNGIFDHFQMPSENQFQTPNQKQKCQNECKNEQESIDSFLKKNDHALDEWRIEKTAGSKRYEKSDNLDFDKRVSLQSKKTRGSLNILSDGIKMEEKQNVESQNVPHFLKDSLNTSPEKFNLFSKNSEIYYMSNDFKRRSLQSDLPIGSNEKNQDLSDESESYFIKPISDVLKESKNTDVYLDEGFLTEYQMTNPFKTLTLDENRKLDLDMEIEDKDQTKLISTSNEFFQELNEKNIEPQSCFLDEDIDKSPIKKKVVEKTKKKVNKLKKVLSLKEKFKKLTKKKKLNKENQLKSNIISEPFHPNIKKTPLQSQKTNYVVTPSNYYYNNQMGYLHGNMYNGAHEMEHFTQCMTKFNMMRMGFQGKCKHDMYYRKDYRFHKSSGSSLDKGEDYSNKYKTEICKNFELTGKCQWGEMV